MHSIVLAALIVSDMKPIISRICQSELLTDVYQYYSKRLGSAAGHVWSKISAKPGK